MSTQHTPAETQFLASLAEAGEEYLFEMEATENFPSYHSYIYDEELAALAREFGPATGERALALVRKEIQGRGFEKRLVLQWCEEGEGSENPLPAFLAACHCEEDVTPLQWLSALLSAVDANFKELAEANGDWSGMVSAYQGSVALLNGLRAACEKAGVQAP